jgi:hypothetical protein
MKGKRVRRRQRLGDKIEVDEQGKTKKTRGGEEDYVGRLWRL